MAFVHPDTFDIWAQGFTALTIQDQDAADDALTRARTRGELWELVLCGWLVAHALQLNELAMHLDDRGELEGLDDDLADQLAHVHRARFLARLRKKIDASNIWTGDA